MTRPRVHSLASIAARYEDRLQLARASDLALSGRLLEAEALIAPLSRKPADWESLDLLARIRVRQGNFADALRLWQSGMEIPGKAVDAKSCIESLTLYAGAELKRRKVLLIALSALWSILAISSVGIVLFYWRK